MKGPCFAACGQALKIVSVWNPKGGQGKSLIGLNLAAAAVAELVSIEGAVEL